MDRGNGKIPYRNPDGYPDPTAHAALNKVKREMDEKDLEVQRFIRALRVIIDKGGYDLLGRIELHDRSTGGNYRGLRKEQAVKAASTTLAAGSVQ